MIPDDDPFHADPDELRARGGIKWNLHGANVLPLWIAEMDFPVAPAIRHALIAAVEASALGYTTFESAALTRAFAHYCAEQYGQDIDPGSVLVVPDVLRGVQLALRLRTPSGAGVIVPTPGYPNLLELPRQLGYPVHEVPLDPASGWRLDLDGIEAAFRAGGHTVLLIQPHNPTGRIWTRAELTGLADLVRRHGGRVVADEVHSSVAYAPHVPYSTIPGAAEHCFTATGTGKGWSIPGLKCAQLVAHNPADRAALAEASPYEFLGASCLGILASEVAYTDAEPWRAQVVAHLAEQGTRLQHELERRLPRLGWRRPDATYFAWLDLRPYGLGADAAAHLLKHGLAVNDGAAFGSGGAGWVRLNYATSTAIVDEAVNRLERALS